MTNEVNNIPELRFPEFNEDWNERTISDSIKILKSGLSRELSTTDIGLPVIRANNLQNYNLVLEDIKYWFKEDPKGAKTENYYLEKNDILVNFINSESKMGTSCIIKSDFKRDTIYTTNILRYVTKEVYDSYFHYIYTQTYNYKKWIKIITKPAVNQASFTTVDFKKIPYYIPKFKEQQKIGAFFSKLDRQIELEEQKLEKLEEQKKGYMQKIFSQELRFKDANGIDYPKWESRYLNELCLINPKVDQLPNTFFYIDLESVKNGKIEKIKEMNKINAPSRAQRLAKKYDVFYQTVRPYQKNNFINLSNRNDIVVSTGYAQLRPSVQFYYLYSLLLTNSFMNKVLVKCTGTNYPAINSTDLSLIQILSSTVFEEQEKIGDFFSKLDELINKQNQKIDRLKKRKKGFLQKMFI